jgi:hypothetical protein
MNNYNLKLIHLLYIHLLLLIFQLPIRQLIIDTTFLRDIIIIFVFCYLLFTKNNINFNSKFHILILILLIFGFFITIIQIINGINPIYSIVNYRNYFFPFLLFYISNKIFRKDGNTKYFVNFLYYIFLFLLLDIWFEYFIFETKLPKTIFPWYTYQFQNSYRYTTSNNSNIESVDPSQTPILGILGWAHATSATFLSLFLFLLPFILDTKKINYFKLNQLKKINLLIFSIGAIIILGVKMQIIILLLFFFLLPALDWKVYFFKLIKYTPIILILLLITEPFWYNSIINRYNIAFIGSDNTNSTFSLIFNYEIITSVFQSIFSNNLVKLFFGGYNLSEFWFYDFLEIRIINYTFEFGIVWLIIFVFIISYSINYSIKKYRISISIIDKYLLLGFILFTVSFVIDSLHYFRLLNWPNIDIFAILLGIVFKKCNNKNLI